MKNLPYGGFLLHRRDVRFGQGPIAKRDLCRDRNENRYKQQKTDPLTFSVPRKDHGDQAEQNARNQQGLKHNQPPVRIRSAEDKTTALHRAKDVTTAKISLRSEKNSDNAGTPRTFPNVARQEYKIIETNPVRHGAA